MGYRVPLSRNEAQRSDQHHECEEAPQGNKSDSSRAKLTSDERARGGAEECEGERAWEKGERRRLRHKPRERVGQDEPCRESRRGSRGRPLPRNHERRQEDAATRPCCASKESDPAANEC